MQLGVIASHPTRGRLQAVLVLGVVHGRRGRNTRRVPVRVASGLGRRGTLLAIPQLRPGRCATLKVHVCQQAQQATKPDCNAASVFWRWSRHGQRLSVTTRFAVVDRTGVARRSFSRNFSNTSSLLSVTLPHPMSSKRACANAWQTAGGRAFENDALLFSFCR